MYNKGQNLIFLISQPRAGSTLTQRMLGAHPLIHTQSEPWILLHPLHALKPDNLISGFNSDFYTRGLNDFIDNMPGGRQKYIETIAEAFGSFYAAILEQKEKMFFLDKTPRYYYILNELHAYYPEAKFIFLWRNPAAVITSIINTWININWFRLSEYKDDFLYAPILMLQGRKNIGEQAFSICYEDLISNPGKHMESLCSFIGIPYEKSMMQYANNTGDKWLYGDQGTVNEKSSPDSSHADNWQSGLDNPQLWRVLDDYIRYLGEKTLSDMGYSYEHILSVLQDNKPDMDIEKHSIALSQLLENTRFAIIENRRLLEIVKQKDKLLNHTHESLQLKNELLKQKDDVLKQKDGVLKQKDNTLKQTGEELKQKSEVLRQKSEELSYTSEVLKQKDEELRQRSEVLKQKDELVRQKEEMLKQKDNEVKQSNDELKQRNDELKLKDSELKKKEIELKKKDEELKQIKWWLKDVGTSLSFKIGHAILWPVRKMLGK